MTHRSVFAIVAALATTLFTPSGAFAQQPAPAAAAPPVSAVASPLAEAIRERIDHLRYEEQQDVRGARIIGNELVARYYESQQFQPAWQDTAKLDELVAAHRGPAQRRSRPDDYHLEALQSYRLDVRMKYAAHAAGSRQPRTARDRRLHARAVPRLRRQGGSGEAQLAVEFLAAPDAVVRGRTAALLGAARGRRDPRSLRQRAAVARLVPARS